jgi:hypothetical protein
MGNFGLVTIILTKVPVCLISRKPTGRLIGAEISPESSKKVLPQGHGGNGDLDFADRGQ